MVALVGLEVCCNRERRQRGFRFTNLPCRGSSIPGSDRGRHGRDGSGCRGRDGPAAARAMAPRLTASGGVAARVRLGERRVVAAASASCLLRVKGIGKRRGLRSSAMISARGCDGRSHEDVIRRATRSRG